MKKYFLIILSIILLAASNAAAQTGKGAGKPKTGTPRNVSGGKGKTAAPTAESKLAAQMQNYIRAVVSQNAEGIYKFMNPEYARLLGGKAAAIGLIKYEFDVFKEQKLSIVSVETKPESQKQKPSGSSQKIKVAVTVKVEAGTVIFDGELTAVMLNNNWYFFHDHSYLLSLGVKEFEDGGENADKEPAESPANETANSNETADSDVLNDEATNLPAPEYPPAAKEAKASGTVNVKVLIDEAGEVILAEAVTGHPLLRESAVKAAKQAKFKPFLFNGQAGKVTGTIVYNFAL